VFVTQINVPQPTYANLDVSKDSVLKAKTEIKDSNCALKELQG